MLEAGIKLLRKDIDSHSHHFEPFATTASASANHCDIMEGDFVTTETCVGCVDCATSESRTGAAILKCQEGMIELSVLLLGR